jgi:hypothetical protein
MASTRINAQLLRVSVNDWRNRSERSPVAKAVVADLNVPHRRADAHGTGTRYPSHFREEASGVPLADAA